MDETPNPELVAVPPEQIEDEEISPDELEQVAIEASANDSAASAADAAPEGLAEPEPTPAVVATSPGPVADTAASTDAGDPDASAAREPAVEELPGHAGTVVVPLSNPSTAADLLAVAIAFCEHGGEVIAVNVGQEDPSQEDAETASALAEIVEEAQHDHPGRRIELLSREAPSVARGIVELARDENADLIVVGVPLAGPNSTGRDGGPPLGRVAEAIIEVAPCDVVVLRPGLDGEHMSDLRRLVVTVDGGEAARTATRSGIVLGEGLGLGVDVVHVQDRGRPRWDGLAVLAQALDGMDGRERVRSRLLHGPDVAGVLVGSCSSTELLVVGLQRESGLRQWLFGSVVTSVLREATGPVLIVARQAVSDGLAGRVERLRRWLQPSLTDVERETLLWNARRQATTTIDYVMLLAVSAVLATLGLVQDSVAVIIGAMLVAPLLGPLSAMSIGLVTAHTALLRRGLVTLSTGTLAAMVVSFLVGVALPLTGPTEQMLLRGQPTLLDVGVALASGLIGAFATARKDIPAALAGVAIAAALVPPLGTVGLGLALGDPTLAGGALLLFLVNIASVVTVGAVAMAWFGMRPVEQDHDTRRRLVSGAVAALLLLVVVTTATALLQSQRAEREIAQQLADEFTLAEGVDLVALEFAPPSEEGGDTIVTATVRSQRPLEDDELRDAEENLAQRVGRSVELRVIVLRVVVAPD